MGRPTKFFLSTFGVPSMRTRGRVACKLNLASRNVPHIKYINSRKTPNPYSELFSLNDDPIAQLKINAIGAIPNVRTSARESNCTPISVAVLVIRATRPSSVSNRIASRMAIAARLKYQDATPPSENAKW